MQSSRSLFCAVIAVAASVFTPSFAAAQAEPAPPPPPAPAPWPEALPTPAPAPPDPALKNEVDALREEVRALKSQVDAAKATPAPQPAAASATPAPQPAAAPATPAAPSAPAPAVAPKPLGYEPFWPWVTPSEGLTLGAYLQSQYTENQSSQDQLAQGGALLNKDRFLIRRARVSLTGEWEYAALAIEVDANTTNGPQVDLRKAEASLQYRPDRTKPPIVMATVGQFDTPFGYELVESPRTRFFMERSTASQAFWPGEPDLGVRIAGALSFFRWTLAAVNGEPIGESSPYQLTDPNGAKDAILRFGVDSNPIEHFHVAGGVSSLRGTGFHPGTDATKSSVTWNDDNNDGAVSLPELSPLRAQGATPSQNFDRWAVGADLRLQVETGLGVTKVYGEFLLGSNMDRGAFFADPIQAKIDQRELGYYVGATQDVTRYGVVGFRYDYYDPNSNAFDSRQGRVLPTSQAIKTYSPLVGLVLPDHARLLFQYDIVKNGLGRTNLGVPANFKSNAWTIRLQVQL